MEIQITPPAHPDLHNSRVGCIWDKVADYNYGTNADDLYIRWFTNAKLNVSYNCLDRHLETRGDQTAIIWKGNDPSESKKFTYKELHTGTPKGVMHTTGGDLTYVSFTHKMIFDYHDGDIYWCTADIGWITGRVDDVINVSGHRMGTAEVESALVSHPLVAKSAVVGYPHPIKGQSIYAFVTLNSGVEKTDELKKERVAHVRKEIGAIATPDMLQWSDFLPKTRSGKIMRRILKKVAAGDFDNSGMGDTSTRADPTTVDMAIEGAKKNPDTKRIGPATCPLVALITKRVG